MFELLFLGTSASAPSIRRGLSAQIVLHKDRRFLVDCGEGTQRQILRSGIGFRRLNTILLTHGHLDHILGLGGLISTLARWEAMEEIEIWGGPSTLERVNALLFGVVLRGDEPPVKVTLRPIEKPGVIIGTDEMMVKAFRVRHRGPDCYGYTFQERERRPFINERAEALGVPQGPERRNLVLGKSVTLADGRIVEPNDVLGKPIPGTKLCITGDVGDPRGLLRPLRHADAVVCEATYLHEEVEMAARFGHMTARLAAETAVEAGVHNLILTHLSRRNRESDILEEAAAIFPDAVVARDFDHYLIRRGQALEAID